MKSQTANAVKETWRAALRLFSGRPNPQWDLTAECIESLQKKLADHVGRDKKKPVKIMPSSGYRGISVSVTRGKRQVQRIDLFRATLEDSRSGCLCDDADDVSRKVFGCMPRAQRQLELDGASYDDLHNEPAGLFPIQGIEGVAINLRCASAPRFIGDRGAFFQYRRLNNCYNYGANKPNKKSLGMALPGGLSGLPGAVAFRERFERDNLGWIGKRLLQRCPERRAHYVAILIRRGLAGTKGDFHVLRLDRNGRWSHKDGDEPVTPLDDAKETIVDLSAARFKWPSDLLGFFEVPKDVDVGPGRATPKI